MRVLARQRRHSSAAAAAALPLTCSMINLTSVGVFRLSTPIASSSYSLSLSLSLFLPGQAPYDSTHLFLNHHHYLKHF